MNKSKTTTAFIGLAAGLCLQGSIEAAPITGPGQIIAANSTANFVNINGGCVGPNAANCTIDGDFTGAGGTFVEWGSTGTSELFKYTLNQPYNITRFLLWNDRGVPDSGIHNFDLIFRNPGGGIVGTFNGNAVPFQGNNPTPEVFSFPVKLNVKTVELRVNTTFDPPGTNTQMREIAFDGIPVPEPASLALLSLGLISLNTRKRRHH